MKKSIKAYILIGLISLIISIVIFPLRGGYFTVLGLTGYSLTLFVGFVLYFIMTIVCLRKFEGKLNRGLIVLSIIIGMIIIAELPIRILHFKDTLGSLLECVGRLIAPLLAWWFAIVKSKQYKALILILSVLICLWLSYSGYTKWLHYINFNTVTGKTEQILNSEIVLQNIDSENISMDNFKGTYLILDFWSSTCGRCIEVFPDVQELYDEIKENTCIELYSVFCRRTDKGEEPKTGVNILHERGFSFPVVSADINDPILEEIGVTAFPTVIIFDPQGKVIFRSNIGNAKKYLKKVIISRDGVNNFSQEALTTFIKKNGYDGLGGV